MFLAVHFFDGLVLGWVVGRMESSGHVVVNLRPFTLFKLATLGAYMD